MAVFRSLYKDHVLSCTTMPLADGRYGAQVAVIYTKGDKTTSQRFVDVPDICLEETEVRDKALAAGREWIDAEVGGKQSGFSPARLLRR